MTNDIPPSEHEATAPIEIAFVNAPFPGEPEPSPIQGMDMATFRNYLMRALDGDESVPPSILTVVQRGSSDATDGKKKDQEFWESVFWLNAIEEQLRRMDDLIRRYEEMARQHHEQAEQARQRMSGAADKLGIIDGFVTGANDVFSEKERTGKLDREKAIELLHMRGVTAKPDAEDATLLTLLREQKTAALGERQSWSAQYEQSSADATRYEQLEKEDRAKAAELIKQRDEIRTHGYDPQEEAIRLKQAADKYEINVQYKAIDIEKEELPENTSTNRPSPPVPGLREMHTAQINEADDFEALAAGTLTTQFTAAANVSGEPPQPVPPTAPLEGAKPRLGSPAQS